ncbi:MAG: CopD family protein [Chloroflexi bacterium]|nr:CopD family protein [Chloroflexota bacterium]
MKIWVFGLLSFLHDLFTAIWMGGLMVTVLSYIPALKEALGPGPQTKKVMIGFQKRQSTWVYISMGGLILTGLLMSRRNPAFDHLFSFASTYSTLLSIKHILVILMIGTTLYRSLILSPTRAMATPRKEQLGFKLLILNFALAIAVLLLSGLGASFANPFTGG